MPRTPERYVRCKSYPCGCESAFDTLDWHGVGWVVEGCALHDPGSQLVLDGFK